MISLRQAILNYGWIYNTYSNNIKEMNVVIQQLSRKQNLQDFLMALLGDVEKYFKSAAPMSEEKAYGTITTIFTRISRDFPLISSIQGTAKRLASDIRDRISDKCEAGREKKKNLGLKSFMEGIKEENEALVKSSSEENQENKHAYVKKMVLESINELKEDIKEADSLTSDILRAKLERVGGNGKELPTIVFVDSFLTNSKIINDITGYKIINVVINQSEVKGNDILLTDAARVVRQARILVLSADAVLRNGGILSKSGTLMLAIIAHQLGIPVLAVSRSYCLFDQILINQESLIHEQSSKSHFPAQEDASFRVQIAKRYDYLQPRLVSTLIGQRKGWQSQSLAQIFQEYYH